MLSKTLQINSAFMMSALLMGVIIMLSKKIIKHRNKHTSFECGFDPKDSARIPFSLRFFLLLLLFLIFDIEVTLLFPLIWALKMKYKFSIMGAILFLLILLLGLFHEWNEGSLTWVK